VECAASASRTSASPTCGEGYGAWLEAKQNTDPVRRALDAVYRSLAMAKDNLDASVVHSHTWYVQFAGFLAKKLWGIRSC